MGLPGIFSPRPCPVARLFAGNEDGLAGICDRHQFTCFSIALWNGRDPILKNGFLVLRA